MFDALNNPRVEFTCHDVVTSGVYSSYHVNMTSKKQVACVVDYISRETASGWSDYRKRSSPESGEQKDGESVSRDA